MIEVAAIKKDGKVYSLPRPARHHNVMHEFKLGRPHEQGFIDDRLGFVGRHQALCIALACKQELRFNKRQTAPGEFCDPAHGLFSEDLW